MLYVLCVIMPTGDLPPRRRGHAAAVVGNTLYVHGGFDGSQHLDDVWALDFTTWAWSRVATQVGGWQCMLTCSCHLPAA